MMLDTKIKEKGNVAELNNESAKALLSKIRQEKERLIKEKLLLNSKGLSFNNEDEAPFSIPQNWIWVRLNEISLIQEGPGIRKSQYQNEGVQFLTVTNILEDNVDLEKSKKYISLDEFNDKYSHFKINKNDIVTACSGGSWGKSAIYNHDNTLILNTSTLRLRFFGDFGDNMYLYYLTKADFFKNQIADQLSGQQPNFGYSHYSIIKIPLPPLREQQRIVFILDEAFSAIATAKANAEQNLKNSKELFECYLNRVFTEEGKSWKEKCLEEVCEISSKLIDPKKMEFQNLIHIGAGNIESKKGTLIDLKSAKEENLISGKFLFDKTMVLYSKIRPYLIKVIRCEFDGLCSADIYPLVPFQNEMIRDFLYYLLLTKKFTDYAILGSQRAGMPKVNREHLFAYRLYIPPIKEQQIIVQKLDALSYETKKLEAIYLKKIADLEELKKSVLQKAFSGELANV